MDRRVEGREIGDEQQPGKGGNRDVEGKKRGGGEELRFGGSKQRTTVRNQRMVELLKRPQKEETEAET